MDRRTEQLPSSIVVLNPDEDCSPAVCGQILDEILMNPDHPVIGSLDAAEVIRQLRNPR